jgi:hypothetical protein
MFYLPFGFVFVAFLVFYFGVGWAWGFCRQAHPWDFAIA